MDNNFLKQLIAQNSRVVIPEFGAFIKKENPDGGEELVFSPFLRKDDGVVNQAIVKNYGVEKEDADAMVEEFISHLRETLATTGRYQISGIGIMTIDPNGAITFKKETETPSEVVEAKPVSPQPQAPQVNPAQPGAGAPLRQPGQMPPPLNRPQSIQVQGQPAQPGQPKPGQPGAVPPSFPPAGGPAVGQPHQPQTPPPPYPQQPGQPAQTAGQRPAAGGAQPQEPQQPGRQSFQAYPGQMPGQRPKPNPLQQPPAFPGQRPSGGNVSSMQPQNQPMNRPPMPGRPSGPQDPRATGPGAKPGMPVRPGGQHPGQPGRPQPGRPNPNQRKRPLQKSEKKADMWLIVAIIAAVIVIAIMIYGFLNSEMMVDIGAVGPVSPTPADTISTIVEGAEEAIGG